MSHTNPYALQPLYIARVDPVTKKYTQAFFFLGAVPKNVLAAARRRQPKAADPRVPIWTAADAAILRAYYGASWRALLTAEDPPSADESLGASLLPMFFTGGGEFDFTAEDEAAFELAPDTLLGLEPEPPAGAAAAAGIHNTGTGNIYTNISVYPEDNIYDLRRKLYLASNVGIYQAHLFYYINDEGPVLPYRITVDGVPVAVDWHNIDAGEMKSMAGIAIDQHMESRRDTITVEAFDLTTLLVPGYPNTSIRITRAYFVDLYSVIPPLSSAERLNDGLADILQDNFQFDLLYYGAILTYWPQLSPNAAKLALLDPDSLLETYPAMGGAVVTEAGTITAQNWAAAQHTASEKAAAWRMPSTVAARPTVAVTHASIDVVAVATRMHVNVRNVFDAIPTSPELPAMVLSQADAPVQKRHLSSYQLRDASLALQELQASSGGGSAESVTFITGGAGAALTQMTLMANGAYSVVRDWPEDDRVGFEMVLAELSKATLPLITKINALKSLAFPIGGTLSMPNSLAKIGSLTVSTFWPHSVSATVFRSIREQIRPYETAGIIRSWGLQRPGVHVFTFYRGISRTRATGHSYSWLVNDQSAGAGRTIRVIHRVLDIRIEIIGADSLAEFDIIRRYIFSFLDGLVTGVFHGAPVPRSKPHDSKGRLRRLREQDPNLFDLKKYDPDATVYSVLCQSNRQPILYSEAEAGQLSNKQQDRLTRYWNYTEKAPVYYTCLDPKYAHLSFRAGIHPLGYCLPCCKKTRISPTSRAAQVNKKCLSLAAPTQGPSGRRSQADGAAGETAAAEAAAETAEAAAPEIMSHILSYGKPIPESRISEIPKELSTALFLEAVAKPHGLYLVGVEQQSLYNLSEAGFAHAIVYAVAPPNTQPDAVIKALANTAASLTETYYHIGNGAGASFASAKALADAILMTFRYDMPTDLGFSPFSAGGAATNSWKAVLTDLVRYTYGVEIVTIVAMGKDATTLVVNPNAAAGIAAGHKFAIFVVNDSGTYPLAVLDPKIFLQTRAADRWMVARRTFSCGVESDVPDKIATTVIDMINSVTAHTTKCLSASFIEHSCGFAGSGKPTASSPDKPKIIKRLADNHGRCYGLILQDSQKRHVYIPIEYSAAAGATATATTELVFGERPQLALPAAALMEVFAMINTAARAASIQEAVIEALLVKRPGSHPEPSPVIGFVANGLYFYHDAIPLDLAEPASALPQIPIPYDCRLIDAAIVTVAHAPPAQPLLLAAAAPLHTAAEAARAQNRLYRLFVAEFSMVLQRERNEKIRERLLNTLRSTNFSNNNSVLVLRKALLSILREYPEDIPIVRDAIARAYTTVGLAQTVAGNEKMFAAIAESLAATVCSFDQLTVARLHAMPSHEATVIAIRKIMEPRIHSVKAPFPGAANMFTTCDVEGSGSGSGSGSGPGLGEGQAQCSRGRLAVPEDRLADFYDLLADDVRNSGKMRLLASIGPGVFSPKEFIIRPDEVLL